MAVDTAEYKRGIKRIADTSEPAAMFRNALTGVQANNSAVILSSSSAYLERSLALAGTRESVVAKVKYLVVTERALSDPASLSRLLAVWPTEVIYCDAAAGDAILFPATSIEKDFTWAPAHPVADAYRSYQPMPYDAPTLDLAAAVYATHPDSPFFELTEPGILKFENGKLNLVPEAGGKHRRLRVVEAKKLDLVKTYTELASAKPPAPLQRFRPPVPPPPPKQPEVKPATK